MVYNESNQLTEAVLCNGRTTRKVCYTYDDDGNLIKEYSPTDNGLTTYRYTVEDRLEAVYTGNAYNRTLQMAAAYDGDGNRVYQVNYNPEKDEDFSCYYGSYNNCDYNGTGIQLKVSGEVSPTEEELIKLIAPAGATLTSKYELIEYINDVNREYAEVLVEQNINGRTDTTYTYGVDRISKELFNQTSRTAYYLYDPRGSVAGLADAEGHLTKTYRYSVTGELTYGSAFYENEYTYNGESYNPNIHSQYLRARYYCVVTANFLTEDSYLGNINEPLTLNRYNYCISSYLNYVDPSGNVSIIPVLGPILPPIFMLPGNTDTDTDGDTDTIDITWDLIQQAGNAIWNQAQPVVGTINSFHKGVTGSIAKAILDKPLVSLMPMAYILEKQYQIIFGSYEDPLLRDPVISENSWSPTKALKNRMARNETMIQGLAGNLENVNAYYIGRCTGDGAVYFASLLEMLVGSGIAGSGGAALVAETASGVGLVAAPGTVVVIAGGVAVAIDGGAMALHQVDMIREDMGRYEESKKKEESEEDEESKDEKNSYKAPEGGGGVTDKIRIGNTEVNFGHGGRHLEGTGLSIKEVNQAIARDAVTKNNRTGQFYKGRIIINGIEIEYTSYGVKDGLINIGTYYPMN